MPSPRVLLPRHGVFRGSGRASPSSGDYGAASQCLASLPQTAQTLYLQGGLLTISGDASSALPFFRRAVAMQPSHADAHFEMGNALLAKRDYAPAEAAFKAALKSEPNRAVYHLNIGNLFSEMGRAKKAEKAFRRALAIEPATWNGCAAANGLSNLLEGSDRSSEAEDVSSAAIAASDQCPYAAHNLGRLLRRRGKHDEAVELARKALALAPTQREFITGLAAALHAAERLEEAIKIYRTALASGPSDHGLATDLANALVQANRHVEAIDAYVNALPLQLAHAAATLPASAPPQRRRTRGAKRIVFYCRLRAHMGADALERDVWGPTTLVRKGVGGSEEAVIMVSRELARRGWDVSVYANPPPEDLAGSSSSSSHDVLWRRWYDLARDEGDGSKVDVLISWRNLEGSLLLPKPPHVTSGFRRLPSTKRRTIAISCQGLMGYFVLSAFHAYHETMRPAIARR